MFFTFSTTASYLHITRALNPKGHQQPIFLFFGLKGERADKSPDGA